MSTTTTSFGGMAQTDLPSDLRTEHWYNDLQHTMFVILFRHALSSLAAGNRQKSETMIDTITMYLYIHFLDEEEGLAFSLSRGHFDRDFIADHTGKHVRFVDYWRDQVFLPFKSQTIGDTRLYDEVEKYYDLILAHIRDTDQFTYGIHSEHAAFHRTEISRIATSRLPLSPFMAGAYEVLEILCPEAARLLNKAGIAPLALKPMGKLALADTAGRLLPNGTGSLRDRIFDRLGRGFRAAMPTASDERAILNEPILLAA